MSLHEEEHSELDISAESRVLEFTYTGRAPKSVLCRVQLGSDDQPIAGGAIYTLATSINDNRISPESSVPVTAGLTRTMLQSRELVLINGDTLTVDVTGTVSDTAIYALAQLLDMTPMTREEILGSGAVAIDHDFGGADTYRAVNQAGAGVDNVQVQAFTAEDYAAGRRSTPFVRGETRTRSDGRWSTSLMLDPGAYTLVFFKQGAYGPNTASLVVPES